MKYHELLFSKRKSAMKGIITIIDYITSVLPMTFDHPLEIMNADDMLGFLRRYFQIFWNSGIPIAFPNEYILYFTQASATTC